MKARVDSLDVFKSFRTALWKFQETAVAALAEAEGDIHRALVWLETEQLTYWQAQIRKRHDWVERCKEAYRQKTIFKDAAGHRYSGFDERKALEKAKREMEVAEEKYANVRKYVRVLQKELQNYSGSVQRFSRDVSTDLPNVAAKLEHMEEQLGQYVALTASTAPLDAGTTSAPAAPSMARGSTDEIADSLRSRTPADADRTKAAQVETVHFLTTAKPLSGPQRLVIAGMDVKRNPPEGSQTVAISTELNDPHHIYLHRTATTDPSDTGWFVGPAKSESSVGDLVKMTVDHLLALRPDWREILALPTDFVVHISAGSIANVYNQKGTDLWNKR